MESLIKYFGGSYYTYLLVFLTSLIAFVFSLKNANGNFKIFQLYFFVYLFCQVFFISGDFVYKTKWWLNYMPLQYTVDFIFTIFEFLIFSIVFYKSFQRFYRIILLVIVSIFLVISFYLLYFDELAFGFLQLSTVENLFLWQSFLLIIPCCLYFHQVFKVLLPFPLISDPIFWVASGLTCFHLATLPFTLLMNYLRSTDFSLYTSLYSIVYIFYMLLFTSILKAISCRQKLAS
jgi:hypothetical protein